MSRDENDMTGDAGSATESASSRNARRKFTDVPISAEELGDAIAKAQQRVAAEALKTKEKPLPDVVRVSVRCGMETVQEGGKVVIRPAKLHLTASETADGQPAVIAHGRPARIKREAYLRLVSEGKVILAQ